MSGIPVKKDPKRGTYYFVLEAGIDPKTGNRSRVKRSGFATQKAAKQKIKELLGESSDGDYVVKQSKQSVRAYLENWLKIVEVKRKPSTSAMYAHKMRRYVFPRIGAMPLRALDASTLSALYAELQLHGGRNDKDGNPTPLSESTVASVHRILHRALADAVKQNLIRHNPANDADVPRSSAVQERNAWNADELRTFLSRVADDRLRALWALFVTTGLRRGEVCGLKWDDVQLEVGSLVVRRSLVPIAGKVTESTPKSNRIRTVALDAATVATLRAHRKRQLEERLAWGQAWRDSGFVFTNEDGTHLRPDAITSAFNAHVEAAGLQRIVLHGLRHTHITLGLAGGIPVKVMQERVGHAKVETTYAYTHVLPGMQEQAAETFARLIER